MRSKQLCLKKIRLAWIGACLLPLISGCATDPVAPQIRVELQRVPEALLTPCSKTTWLGGTYQDAIELAIARGKDIDDCNARLEDIRKWSLK